MFKFKKCIEIIQDSGSHDTATKDTDVRGLLDLLQKAARAVKCILKVVGSICLEGD